MGEQKRRRAAGAEDLRLQGPKPGGFRLFAAFERWMAKDTPWRGEPGEFGRRQRERAFERRLDRILLSGDKRRLLLAKGKKRARNQKQPSRTEDPSVGERDGRTC